MTKSKLLLIAPLLLLGGCIAHIPIHTWEHLNVSWRPSYQAARADAERLGRPILVVMIAGEKDADTCLGGDWLRSAALRDPEVIKLINDEFVPVWVNVRTTPIPPFPFLKHILVNASVDAENRVSDLFSRTFFLRSVIVSPDGQTLLNPGAESVAETMRKLVFDGTSSYETNRPDDYLSMLQHALARFRAQVTRSQSSRNLDATCRR